MSWFNFGGSKSKAGETEIQIASCHFLPVSFSFGSQQVELLDKNGNFMN
jgi:hypothetical protein